MPNRNIARRGSVGLRRRGCAGSGRRHEMPRLPAGDVGEVVAIR